MWSTREVTDIASTVMLLATEVTTPKHKTPLCPSRVGLAVREDRIERNHPVANKVSLQACNRGLHEAKSEGVHPEAFYKVSILEVRWRHHFLLATWWA